MKEPRFEEGDEIKFFPPESHTVKYLGSHKFAGVWQLASIAFVDEEMNRYGVWTEYGQDYIDWKDAHKR